VLADLGIPAHGGAADLQRSFLLRRVVG
jgi:hypothetical protein